MKYCLSEIMKNSQEINLAWVIQKLQSVKGNDIVTEEFIGKEHLDILEAF